MALFFSVSPLSRSAVAISSLRLSSLSSSVIPLSLHRYSAGISKILRRLSAAASLSTTQQESESESAAPLIMDPSSAKLRNRWRPMCLYYTQGKCTKLDDAFHLEKFNHNCSSDLYTGSETYKNARAQQLDFFLVLDLEGKVEILEFPVLMIDAKTMAVVDIFHRFVRPSVMTEERINEYIEGKYGKLGVDRVWHDTAIPFDEVIDEFEAWMSKHHLWEKQSRGSLINAAFITCGNWDLKTKVPQQCKVSRMSLPPYFMEWINLKDVYLNFYNRRATGMVTMMRELEIPLIGSHHLGIDDTKNIARVVQRMIIDGAILQISARRSPNNLENVDFLFKNRIR